MLLAYRLRAIREAKNLSQGDIEERSGLKRSYISRVENGHTVPSVETLEKLARALEVPLYQIFYENGSILLPSRLRVILLNGIFIGSTPNLLDQHHHRRFQSTFALPLLRPAVA